MTTQEYANRLLAEHQAERNQESGSTDEVRADQAIFGLSFAVNDLTDVIKTREGLQTVRANFRLLMDAKHKLDDLMFELGPFAAAAE